MPFRAPSSSPQHLCMLERLPPLQHPRPSPCRAGNPPGTLPSSFHHGLLRGLRLSALRATAELMLFSKPAIEPRLFQLVRPGVQVPHLVTQTNVQGFSLVSLYTGWSLLSLPVMSGQHSVACEGGVFLEFSHLPTQCPANSEQQPLTKALDTFSPSTAQLMKLIRRGVKTLKATKTQDPKGSSLGDFPTAIL